MSNLRPVFLVSLPRSGSTLLQKMLTVSPEIHSVSEPWLILPLAFMLRRDGMLTWYNHEIFSQAIRDFIKMLPNGLRDFYSAVEHFIESLYLKTGPEATARYFLDKTPRYYLILPFLKEAFPNARFIFLFRNPLEVLSSILMTWHNGRLIIDKVYVDLFRGPVALSKGYDLLRDRSVAVYYEDLVKSPETELKKICSHLQIGFDPTMVVDYKSVKFAGTTGDQKSINEFDRISTAPVGKWKSTLNTAYRKRFCKRYVESLGDEVLATFRTSAKELTEEIDSISELRRGSVRDMFYHFVSNMRVWVSFFYYKKLFRSVLLKGRFYPYM